MNKKYNALIIGAGSIGALKPDKYDSPKTKEVLTIAHAMYNNKRIVFDIWDSDIAKEDKAKNKWKIKFNPNENMPIDIVAVCVPTDQHANTIKEVIKNIKPKLIIAEKPFCSSKKQAAEIVKQCRKNNTHLVIDYIRRYDSSTYIIKNEIDHGTVYWASVAYNRGFIHEACHAVDLMNLWLGSCTSVSLPVKTKGIIDRDGSDPTRPVTCIHNGVPVFYLPVDGREFSIFEITIMTNRGKIVLSDHGKLALFYNKIKEPTYGDYYTINSRPIRTQTELTTALGNMIDHCVQILDTGEIPEWICSGEQALAVHDVIDMYNKARGR